MATIYRIHEGSVTRMDEVLCENVEVELQNLLERSPELLAAEQIDPDHAPHIANSDSRRLDRARTRRLPSLYFRPDQPHEKLPPINPGGCSQIRSWSCATTYVKAWRDRHSALESLVRNFTV